MLLLCVIRMLFCNYSGVVTRDVERARLQVLWFDSLSQKDYIGVMKTKDTYVRARVDGGLKRDAERVFYDLGLSMTEAIRLFLVQVRINKGLPFQVGLKPSINENDDILRSAKKRQETLDMFYED